MTAQEVKRRLREAANTFKAWNENQPHPLAKGYGNGWPQIVRDAAEAYGWTPEGRKLPPPYPHEITRMDEAIGWLHLLPEQDARMLWGWANGRALWKIAQRFGKSERTINNWINRACGVIAGSLARAA